MNFKTFFLIIVLMILLGINASSTELTFVENYCIFGQDCTLHDLDLTGNFSFVGSIVNVTILNQNIIGQLTIDGTLNVDDNLTVDTTTLHVDSAGNRVGIGTTAPGALLDVRGAAIFNEDGDDADFRVEGDTNANLIIVDAGKDTIGFGTTASSEITVNLASTISANDAQSLFVHSDLTYTTSTAGTRRGSTFDMNPTFNSGVTIAEWGMVEFSIPTITLSGSAKITEAATVHIVGAPTAGDSVYALWVNDGDARFDGSVNITNGLNVTTGNVLLGVTSGNVGIGTTTPTAPLEVAGDVVLSGGSQNYNFTDRSTLLSLQGQSSGSGAGFELYSKDGDGTDNVDFNIFAVGTPDSIDNRERLLIRYDSGGFYALRSEAAGSGTVRPITFVMGSTEAARIDSSGNVGIGTTTPSDFFYDDLVVDGSTEGGTTIVSTTTGKGVLAFGDGTSGNARYRGRIIYDHNLDSIAISTSGFGSNEVIYMDSSGNVGIGTISPNFKLDVDGTINASGYSTEAGAGLTGSCASTDTLTVQDGIIVACS